MGPVVFLLFISLLLPAHDVTEGNVDTSLDIIRSRSLLQFRIHLVLLSSESEIWAFEGSGNKRNNWPGMEVVVGVGKKTRMRLASTCYWEKWQQPILSAATLTAIRLTCKAYLNSGLCSISVRGLPYLLDALNSSERKHGQGVVTGEYQRSYSLPWDRRLKLFLTCGFSSLQPSLSVRHSCLYIVANLNAVAAMCPTCIMVMCGCRYDASRLDDPLTWGILPARMYMRPHMMRWTLGASNIMFTNPWGPGPAPLSLLSAELLSFMTPSNASPRNKNACSVFSAFFRKGQVIETFHSAGICQPAVNLAIEKLRAGAP